MICASQCLTIGQIPQHILKFVSVPRHSYSIQDFILYQHLHMKTWACHIAPADCAICHNERVQLTDILLSTAYMYFGKNEE